MNQQNKTLEYYMSLPYEMRIIPDEEGGWFVEIPLLRGCMTDGDTWEEVLKNIEEAKQAWLETALEHNITIPEPETVNA